MRLSPFGGREKGAVSCYAGMFESRGPIALGETCSRKLQGTFKRDGWPSVRAKSLGTTNANINTGDM